MFDQHRSFLPSVDVCFAPAACARSMGGRCLLVVTVKTARVLATMAIVGALLPCRSRVEVLCFFIS